MISRKKKKKKKKTKKKTKTEENTNNNKNNNKTNTKQKKHTSNRIQFMHNERSDPVYPIFITTNTTKVLQLT